MRYFILAGIFAILLLAGCVSPPQEVIPEPQPTPPTHEETCRMVDEYVPVVTEECGPVSYTEQVCGERELPFTVVELPSVNLCVADGPCVGHDLGECQTCSKAMTRCVWAIENKDLTATGTWTVAANFTIGAFGFNKEPISQTIGPNQTATFDFYQIYMVSYPISSAVCHLALVDKAVVDDCHQETRTKTECQNVTTQQLVQKQVCD
ncbi:hypothetical protein H0O00_01380 [Candidatus Micrarchaeota archaeon]|nr:hypothetical protein [Candidatus Micrarchaeota archaeon]